MRLRFLWPVAVLLGLVLLFAFGLRHDPRQIPSPLIGKPAPAFALNVLDEARTPITEQALLGRPLLVNFWASWCVACRVEHPLLMQLAQHGVEIIGIDYKDTDEAGRQSLTRHGNPYRQVITDPDGQAGLDWGVYGVPESYVLDADGTIIYKHIGPIDAAVWENTLAPLLAGTPRTASTTP